LVCLQGVAAGEGELEALFYVGYAYAAGSAFGGGNLRGNAVFGEEVEGVVAESEPDAYVTLFVGFDPAVFEAVFYEGLQDHGGDEGVGLFDVLNEFYVSAFADTHFLEREEVFYVLYLFLNGDFFGKTVVGNVAQHGREVQDAFGGVFVVGVDHAVDVVEGVKKEVGVDLRFQEAQLHLALFVFELRRLLGHLFGFYGGVLDGGHEVGRSQQNGRFKDGVDERVVAGKVICHNMGEDPPLHGYGSPCHKKQNH